MSKSKNNTFGEYNFPEWVPVSTKESISEFWGEFGRSHKDWLINAELSQTELCSHGPGPNGFGNPPLWAMADYVVLDYKATKKFGESLYKIIRGRYIHHWNNIGSIVDEYGEQHHISSCDRWIRVWENEEEKAA